MNKDKKNTQEQKITVQFRLNGISFKREVPFGWTLLRFLRDGLGYYGTKCGCEIGECGVCTVLFNGQSVNACLILAPQIEGANIWTIEGVTPPGAAALHPIQKAFVEYDAAHCGFCSPGMIMSIIALFLNSKNPDEASIKQALAGNLCRCTGYAQIIEAVKKAAAIISEDDLKKFNAERSGEMGVDN
jgi:aerobic carbon-monoxide dehydrogenase small subunit